MTADYPLISVIIPVYNVEKYLRRCVDSVLAQTYPNIEIILVNDGSSDNSQAICEEYARTQPTVRALKKTNGGQSSARNFGLNSAWGKYIGFVDSDDWIEPDMFEYLFKMITQYEADASQVEYELVYSNNDQLQCKKEKIDIVSGRDKILEYYMRQSTVTGFYSVCICLFDGEIARKYRFREGKTAEDMDYKFKVLSESKRFVSSNQSKYYYFQSGSSTSSGILAKKDYVLYENAEVLYDLADKENYGDIRFLGKVKKARTAFSLLSKAAFYGVANDISSENINQLTIEHRRNLSTLLKAPLPISRKIAAALLAINFRLTKALISVYKAINKNKL